MQRRATTEIEEILVETEEEITAATTTVEAAAASSLNIPKKRNYFRQTDATETMHYNK